MPANGRRDLIRRLKVNEGDGTVAAYSIPSRCRDGTEYPATAPSPSLTTCAH